MIGSDAIHRTLVLWDVDHTLSETRGVGWAIYDRAFPAATGKPLAKLAKISERTELDIMTESLRINDLEPTEGETRAAFVAHALQLPTALAVSKIISLNWGYLMPAEEVYLTEFKSLKDEQVRRIAFRDNLLYANFGAVAAVSAVALGAPGRQPLLLLAPLASIVLGWTYVVNDQKISMIGEYIQFRLTPLIAQNLELSAEPLLAWESYNKDGINRRLRKLIQTIVDIVCFCGAGAISILFFWVTNTVAIWAIVLSLMELALLLGLSSYIIANADLRGPENQRACRFR
jgi:hypothetical protein